MWLPYNSNQELSHISLIFTYWIPWLYKQYTWIAIAITLIALLPLCLHMYQKYCTYHWWKFVEGIFVYPRPNIYTAWFLDLKEVIDFYQETGILIALIVACHYLSFFIISKILLLLALVFVPIYTLGRGYYDLLFLLIYIILLNLGYYYDFSIGLPIIPPHYYLNWLSFLNSGHPVVINPYDFIIDTNKYMYVYALLLLYIALFRHILNFFYWKKVKYVPFRYKHNLRSDEGDCIRRTKKIHKLRQRILKQRQKKIEAGTYTPKAKSITQTKQQALTIEHNASPTTSNTNSHILKSLKLLGFKQQSIKLMLVEYSAELLTKTLEKLDTIGDLTNPKAQFLELLEETN